MKQELERDAPEVDVFLGRVISRGLNDPPSFQVPLFGILLRGADTAVGFGQIEEFDLFFPDGASRLLKEDLGALGSRGDRVAMAILVSRLQGLAGVSREASFRLALWSGKGSGSDDCVEVQPFDVILDLNAASDSALAATETALTRIFPSASMRSKPSKSGAICSATAS